MVKFTFFVHCSSWKTGGYENTHFAKNKAEAKRIVAKWNQEGAKVTLLKIESISDKEFTEDLNILY